MNDTGATMLIAFTTSYPSYVTVKDVVGGPNTWYMLGMWGIGNVWGVNVFVAINPITSTAATFRIAGGTTVGDSSAQIWACNGVNTQDLFYKASGALEGSNSASLVGTAMAPTDTVVNLRLLPSKTILNGDYIRVQPASQPVELMLVLDASNQSSLVVQRGVSGTTAAPIPANQAMLIGSGVNIPSCKPPAAITPSAVGDLEFVAAGRSGVGSPTTQTTTATIDTPGFTTPVAIGGLATGTAGTVVMSWRVATDLSSFQPTLTMSASDMWKCASLVIKASTSPSSPEPPPLIHTVVGNGYQCNNPPPWGPSTNADCPQVAPGNGGPPILATLNWPSEMLWYHHNVPPDKVMVFVDNQANLIRAVNFDTVPHTVANVVIQPNTIGIIAGTGNQTIGGTAGVCGPSSGPALSATILHPASISEDPTTGNLAIGDQQCATVDIIDTSGNLHWALGGGSGGTTLPGCGVQANHGHRLNVLATQALVSCTQGNDFDASGNLISMDSGNYLVFVNMQSTTINAYGVTGIQPGYAVAIAGNGIGGCSAKYTPQPALSTPLQPLSIYVDRPTGDIYFGSAYCEQAAKVTANGNVVLLAGIDTGGATPPAPYSPPYSPDGTPASSAGFGYVFRATKEADGLVHFTDTDNNLIRHIDANGKIVTDIGNYQRWGPKASALGGAWYGDKGSAGRFALSYPIGYAYDSQGNLCVTSLMNNIIACTYGGVAPPTPIGGAFIAAAMTWVGKAFIAGAGPPGAAQPVYGGVGQPGATSTVTLQGNTVVLSTGDILGQLQTTPEQVGQSWTFSPTNQSVYLILFGGNRTFKDANGFNFAFNPPIAVSVGGVTMYMYQSINALNGTFTVTVAS